MSPADSIGFIFSLLFTALIIYMIFYLVYSLYCWNMYCCGIDQSFKSIALSLDKIANKM